MGNKDLVGTVAGAAVLTAARGSRLSVNGDNAND